MRFYQRRRDPRCCDLIINIGRPDDRSKHGSVEHPWARAGLESFITPSPWGLYEGPGRKDAIQAVTFVLPLLIMAPSLKRRHMQKSLTATWTFILYIVRFLFFFKCADALLSLELVWPIYCNIVVIDS